MNLNNRVQLIGNISAEPLFKIFDSGNKMLRFTVCTTDVYKADDRYIKDTQYHTVVAWGKTAETAEKNLKMGEEIVIDGRLTKRSYTDKNGVQQLISEVVANTIIRKSGNLRSHSSSDLRKSA